MQQINLEAVDVDGAVREAAEEVAGDTRLSFLRKGAVAGGAAIGGGAILGGLIAPGAALAKGRPPKSFGKGDIGILNYALTLEYLESSFYNQATAGGAVKNAQLSQFLTTVTRDENAHVKLLKKALGAKAVKKPKFDFQGIPNDETKFAATAYVLENTGVHAYLGQAPNISAAKVLLVAASIVTVEARHSGAIGIYLGKAIAPNGPLDNGLPASKVLAAVKSTGFIKKSPLGAPLTNQLGQPPQARERLAYDRQGRGEPLVLLHPLGADRTIWRPVLPYLVDHRDVISVDLPGFGDSPPLPGDRPPTPARLALPVLGLLASLGLDGSRVHLAGNSLGGWIALEAAAAGHAATVTAIAPAGLWPTPLAPKAEIGRNFARALAPIAPAAMRSRALKRLSLRSTVAHPDRVPPSDAATLIRSYAHARDYSAVNRAMRAGTFTLFTEISARVTLVWAEHDRLIRKPDYLPTSVEQRVLLGCGHIPMWDDARAVAAALLAGSRSDAGRA